MAANNKIRGNVRAMSPSHNPSLHQLHTYPSTIAEIKGYLELYDRRPIPTLGGTPVSLWNDSVASAGARPHKQLVLDTAMRAITAFEAPAKHGKAKISRQGVRIRNLWYMCDALREPGIEGTRVPATYEPLDARIAYVLIGKTWHECHADYPELQGRTHDEIRIASVELRRRLGIEPSMAELARFLLEMQAREATLAIDKQTLVESRRATEQRAVVSPAPTDLTPLPGPYAIAPSDFDGEIDAVATYEQAPPTIPPAQRPAA
jgi:hypothetical protein